MTLIRRRGNRHYPRDTGCHRRAASCRRLAPGGDGSLHHAGSVPAPQDVGLLRGRQLGGLEQHVRRRSHTLVGRGGVRAHQVIGGGHVCLFVIDDDDVFGHLFELVDQPLAFDFGQDATLVVIPEGKGSLEVEQRGATDVNTSFLPSVCSIHPPFVHIHIHNPYESCLHFCLQGKSQ